MIAQREIRYSKGRVFVAGLIVLVLLAVAPLAAADGFSGDDAYDPAAGGMSVLFRIEGSKIAASSFSFSGDDAYDPAAGGTPEASISASATLVSANAKSAAIAGSSLSGDDDYDPAAGAKLELFVSPIVVTVPGFDCGLTAEEIEWRSAQRIAGGYSGDDAYDSAAGGTPEVSLLTGEDPGLLAACVVDAVSN